MLSSNERWVSNGFDMASEELLGFVDLLDRILVSSEAGS